MSVIRDDCEERQTRVDRMIDEFRAAQLRRVVQAAVGIVLMMAARLRSVTSTTVRACIRNGGRFSGAFIRPIQRPSLGLGVAYSYQAD